MSRLFDACLQQWTTPQGWSESSIHLLPKDGTKPNHPSNMRPITLSPVFRKLFEIVLLRRFSTSAGGWAHFHPAQAGFRRAYSTLSNAALLHILLESKQICSIVFLDFRAAFDVVKHLQLDEVLRGRGCPDQIRALIIGLMFRQVRSRVLANNGAPEWFQRTRGLLQGSPLSPMLFNLFVDDLLHYLNRNAGPITGTLFYADDGTLLGRRGADMQAILDEVQECCDNNHMEPNISKCGLITQDSSVGDLLLDGEKVSRLERYDYLGFPMTIDGIDFPQHFEDRIQAAVKRADFLTLFAAEWGVAHWRRLY